MKIKIMTNTAISYIKNNIDTLLDKYVLGSNPEKWISDALGKKAFVEVEALEFDNFNLEIDERNPASSDVFNIKVLYTKLKQLNDSFATDERLWAGLSHTIFFDYLIKRWKGSNTKDNILNHFFFNGSKPRCYMVNSLARLWWIGKKTYVENEENPFYILDYIAHDINGYAFTLFGSNWSNSERSLKLFFDAILKYEKDTSNSVGRTLFNDAMKYTNCLCGLYVVDACDDNFISDKIYDYLTARYEEIQREIEFNKLNNVKTTGIDKLDNLIKAINKIGGHGTSSYILSAYEVICGQPISNTIKEYVKRSLEEYSPDSPSYKGKPIFYKIYIDGTLYWKVANDYLTVNNHEKRNQLLTKQINALEDGEKKVFNIITSFKTSKFTLEEIEVYKTALINVWKVDNFNNFVKTGLKKLSQKGLIEKISDSEYKKSYIKFAII